MSSVPHSHPQPSYHPPKAGGSFDILRPLRSLLDRIQVKNSRFAHRICQVIPCCCPFERDIQVFGRTFHIPALCKLNPLYDEVVALRFRALSYLVDECGEDITRYIC
ncbi:Mo-dependent nitrogenase C-terminal domain-containing protein [Cronbergia sp. UHCC 0137]|uniref:Mo-dependent nitrogenase C-terminal domain-containing protein n=1 Tax=Cronbergia sp. UHCC 0137 TaxID=3110239 RepID=UPI002B1F387C|nr:Mo-dependent nitrogenase C-terminal domain-containing protein [Cronbergia sp. UHCC 0137]MEA5620839.1 Mo-dependent nitrogenase C-terminal domain-containing protein [Cronbergia sp. UHCC 0137]